MTDHEFMRHAFKGNEDAVRIMDSLRKVAGVWDDLVDGDRRVSSQDVSDAFWAAMVDLPANPLFAECSDMLQPIIIASIVNWKIANAYERGSREDRVRAHVLRYSVADVATMLAFLIGGADWVDEVGPELRRRCQKDSLDNFLNEMEDRHGAPEQAV